MGAAKFQIFQKKCIDQAGPSIKKVVFNRNLLLLYAFGKGAKERLNKVDVHVTGPNANEHVFLI